MQLDEIRVDRRRGHGIAPVPAVFQYEIEILPGIVSKRLRGRQLQRDLHYVISQFLETHHARGHFANLNIACHTHFVGFNGQVAQWFRLAKERVALLALFFRNNLCGTGSRLVFAFRNPPLARRAGAVTAAIGKNDASGERRIQYGLPVFHGELMLTGQYGDLETHSACGSGKLIQIQVIL